MSLNGNDTLETRELSDVRSKIPMIQFIIITFCGAFVGCLILKQLLGSGRKYRLPPGPRGLPVIGHMHLLGTAPHRSLMQLAEKYGSIMHLRLGFCPTVVVSSPDMACEVLKVQDQHLASRHLFEAGKILAYDNTATSLLPYNDKHRLMRKIFSTDVVSAKSIEQSKGFRNEELLNTVEDILVDGHKGSPVNFDEKLTTLILNQTTRFHFQRTYYGTKRTDSAKDADDFRALVTEVGDANFFYPAEFFPFLKFLDLGGVGKRLPELARKADNFYSSIMASRRNKDGSCILKQPMDRDFLDVLCAYQRENPQEMSDDMIKATIQDVILASTSTSATTILWALAEILRNPDVLRTIQNELDTVVGTDRLVQESDINKLEYLLAVIKENFRLHPPLPLMFPHQSEFVDVKIGGYDIPAKTWVLVNTYAIGRNPQVWKDPLEFNPGRFTGSLIDVKGQHFELLPFGSGRRMCVGYNLALTNVEMCLAQLLQTCNLSLPEGMSPKDISMDERSGVGVDRAEALKLRVHPRLPAYVYEKASMII